LAARCLALLADVLSDRLHELTCFTSTKVRILTQNAAARCLALLADVLNNRLYERVREKGGLGAHITCFTSTQVVGLLS
jgi:hypothetical protein